MNLAGYIDAFFRQFNYATVFSDNDVFFRHTQIFSNVCVFDKVTVFAVHRDKIFRPHQIVHQFNFFLASVTGNVYAIGFFVNYFCTQFVKMVDGTRNKLFVTGNRSCRNNYCITGHNTNFFVVIHCHTSQGTHRFALATGGDDYDLVSSVIVGFININQYAFRNIEITKFHSNINYVNHAATDYSNFAFVLHCTINNLLDAVHVGREGCYDDAVACVTEFIIKSLTNHFFTLGEAGAFCISTICQKRKHACITKFSELIELGNLAINGGLVKFKVTGMNNGTDGSFNNDRHSVRNTVVYADEF